jgi:hypothetical protein
MKQRVKKRFNIIDEDTLEKIQGENIIEIHEKVYSKVFPGLNTKLSCFLNNMIGQKGRALNILYNFANDIEGNNPDAEGSLQSQCGKTAHVMNMLFERKRKESTFTKKSLIYYSSEDEDVNNHENFLEVSGDLFDTLDKLKNQTGDIWYSNIEIKVPCLGLFPGHVFNVIVSSETNDYVCRNIYIVQSFIYAYNLKIFWTNDINDLSEFIGKYMDLFLEPFNLEFTQEEDEIAKQIFGTPLLDFEGNSLVGREKPEEIEINIYSPVTIDDIKYKMNLFIGKVKTVLKQEKRRGKESFDEYLDKHIYITPYYSNIISKEEKLTQYIDYLDYLNYFLQEDVEFDSLVNNFELLTQYGIKESRESTRSSQFSQIENEE